MEFRKPPKEKWLVFVLPGATQMEVQEKDSCLFNDFGLFIRHNDGKETTTFVPSHAVTMIRTWTPHPQSFSSVWDVEEVTEVEQSVTLALGRREGPTTPSTTPPDPDDSDLR